MRPLLTAAIALAVLCGSGAMTRSAEPPQIRIQIHLREAVSRGPNEAEELDTLSRPTIQTLEGQTALVSVGQTVRGLECGIKIELVPWRCEGGWIGVDLSVSNTQFRTMADGSVRFTADTFRDIRFLKPGVVNKVILWRETDGKRAWVELTPSVVSR